MEEDVTDAGLAGKGVDEGNEGNAVAGTVDVGSGFIIIDPGDSVRVGISVAGGVSLRTFKSETTIS